MNYIGLLTKEEKSTLCEIITGKEFKKLFKQNEQEFAKIQKGFRAKSLKDQHALSIAIANIDKPFIARWVNTRVEHWVKEIEENIVKLEGEGFSHGAALATIMMESFFANNIELYFKLTGSPLTMDACSNLYERIGDMKSERAKDVEMSELIKTMEEENRHLSNQVERVQHNIDTIKTGYEERLRKIEQDKNKLEALLTEAQEKISELEATPSAFKIDNADYLAQFDDIDISILPSVNTDEIVSLCCVTTNDSGQKRLVRYADLNSNGYYYIFHRNEDIPQRFTNRDKIFYKGEPSEDGFYGIWTWSAVPNKKDPSKDYIQSRYNTEIQATELVNITQAASLDELVNLLKKGINYRPRSRRVMFFIHTSKEQYTGILCTVKQLNTINEKTTISADCIVVPIYEFTEDDIMCLNNGLSFYRKAFVRLPSELYYLKSSLEIVKNIVLSSISWNAYKATEVTRTQYKAFKDFIDEIPVDDIICKIEDTCHCPTPAAKELLDEFLNIVWKYVDGDSLEDKIVRSAISVNIELQEKAKAFIRQDWEKENESLLIEARQELDLLHVELKSAAENLDKAKEALNKTKTEDKRLSDIIAKKETLVEGIEKAVAERIQKARENVADFIASMVFIGGQPVQVAGAMIPSSFEGTSERDTDTYCISPELENLEDLEAHHSWADVINTAVFELAEAGVAEPYRSGLSAFLCAAYIEKQPLLLIGPNAIDISQAFSAAVTAHKHGILCCEGDYVRQAIEKMGNDDEKIVIINNLLASGWMNRLPEILSNKDIFYIATHPYAEDIQVEPKSLYGFMLPLFTEFLVDKKATGKYYGGYFSDDFEFYSTKIAVRKEIAILPKFALSSLVRNQINNLVTTMHNIYPSATTDDDFLFCIFPVAYASMAINELAEVIADSQKGIVISANLKRNLRYVLGEN